MFYKGDTVFLVGSETLMAYSVCCHIKVSRVVQFAWVLPLQRLLQKAEISLGGQVI